MMQRSSSAIASLLGFILIVAHAETVPAQDQTDGKKYAVLVGINEYAHSDLEKLRFAVRDVTEMDKLLGEAGYTVSLICDQSRNKPTKKVIEQEIKRVLEGCKAGDTVVLAFAGHGLQFEGKPDAYFCPNDARPSKDRTDTLVSFTEVYNQMANSFATSKVLFVDACRNDPDPARSGVSADVAPLKRGIAALFSCSAGQRSFENEKLGHGVFFHYVLEGLRGKARDIDGDVNFDFLSGYVRKQVAQQVPLLTKSEAKQFPNMRCDVSGTPPILIKRGDLPIALAQATTPVVPNDQNGTAVATGTAGKQDTRRSVSSKQDAGLQTAIDSLPDGLMWVRLNLKETREQGSLRFINQMVEKTLIASSMFDAQHQPLIKRTIQKTSEVLMAGRPINQNVFEQAMMFAGGPYDTPALETMFKEKLRQQPKDPWLYSDNDRTINFGLIDKGLFVNSVTPELARQIRDRRTGRLNRNFNPTGFMNPSALFSMVVVDPSRMPGMDHKLDANRIFDKMQFLMIDMHLIPEIRCEMIGIFDDAESARSGAKAFEELAHNMRDPNAQQQLNLSTVPEQIRNAIIEFLSSGKVTVNSSTVTLEFKLNQEASEEMLSIVGAFMTLANSNMMNGLNLTNLMNTGTNTTPNPPAFNQANLDPARKILLKALQVHNVPRDGSLGKSSYVSKGQIFLKDLNTWAPYQTVYAVDMVGGRAAQQMLIEVNGQKILSTFNYANGTIQHKLNNVLQAVNNEQIMNANSSMFLDRVLNTWDALGSTAIKMKVIPGLKVLNRATVGIEIVGVGMPIHRAYFDQQTGRLARTDSFGTENGQSVVSITIIEGYNTFNGILLSTKARKYTQEAGSTTPKFTEITETTNMQLGDMVDQITNLGNGNGNVQAPNDDDDDEDD